MTPIEQAKEALQEVSDTMDRKGGVAPIIRLDTLKKVNAALSLLKTMEGEPVAWMRPVTAELSEAVCTAWVKDFGTERHEYTIPLYLHPSPQSDTLI